MYKNTGPKIVALANIIAGITIALFAISGIAIWVLLGSMENVGLGFFAFLIIAAVGGFLAWVSNLLLAGFGELITNTHTIASANIPKVQVSTSPLNPLAQEIPLVRLAYLSLEEGDWDKADELFDQALTIDPENAKVYIGKLCVEYRVCHEEKLIEFKSALIDNATYKKALRFADDDYRKIIDLYTMTHKEQEERDQKVEAEEASVGNGIFNFTYKARIEKIIAAKDKSKANKLKNEYNVLSQADKKRMMALIGPPINIDGKLKCPLCDGKVSSYCDGYYCTACDMLYKDNDFP